ncbi:MAG TPA: hypothetical protein VLJ39_14765 [Tepidisphaeraceae bacterium]|nr:hypothetical protein [Tepidisphaeraceae bacterium]
MPRRSWAPLIVSALSCAGSLTLAQHTQPATAPVADLSTPRTALRALNQAMREGDVETIKRLFLASNPSEVKMIEADAEMAAALAELRRAAIKQFGEEGARTVTGDSGESAAKSVSRIDTAEIDVRGDVATIVYPDQKDAAFALKKVRGEWRVPMSDLGKPLDAGTLEQRLSDLSVQRKVVLDITRQIRAGTFANAEQAREAWQTRILQAATSQPAKH